LRDTRVHERQYNETISTLLKKELSRSSINRVSNLLSFIFFVENLNTIVKSFVSITIRSKNVSRRSYFSDDVQFQTAQIISGQSTRVALTALLMGIEP